jgi:hypothetical protein
MADGCAGLLRNGQPFIILKGAYAVTHETLDQIKLAQHKLIAKS